MSSRRTIFAGGSTGLGRDRSINLIVTDYKKFIGVVEEEAERILLVAANMVLEATLPYVPHHTGALKESGRARVIKTAKGLAAVVSFGGPDAPVTPTANAPGGVVWYAPMVHEDLQKYPLVTGEPYFLVKGGNDSKADVDAYIRSELRSISP